MTERFTKYVPHSYGYTHITTIIDNEKNKQTGNIDEIVDMLNELHEENEQLKQQLFEARKDYLIETADISDKLYLDEMIEEERKEIFE